MSIESSENVPKLDNLASRREHVRKSLEFESQPTAATTTTERKIMRVGAEAESSEALLM